MATYDLTKKLTIPSFLRSKYATAKVYRAMKRFELSMVIRASAQFNTASALLPWEAYTLWCSIRDDMNKLREMLRVKNWEGRGNGQS